MHREGEGAASLSGAEMNTESYSQVFECSGHVSGFELAVAASRPRGRLVLMSRYPLDQGFDLRFLTEKEVEIVGVSGGRLEPALDYLQRKRVDTLPLVEATLPLAEAPAALEKASLRGTLKVVVHNALGGGRP